MNTYEKIELVMKKADRPLTEFEFDTVILIEGERETFTGRRFIGCSESTLGRRLRELRRSHRVTSRRREGKPFVEYELAKVPQEAVGA